MSHVVYQRTTDVRAHNNSIMITNVAMCHEGGGDHRNCPLPWIDNDKKYVRPI